MVGDFTRWPFGFGRLGWVEDVNGCHIWNGDRHSGGYGRVKHEGRMQIVSRVRYEMEIGPIPEGLFLDHFVCDNGPGGCCNPHHCRPVTNRENTLRSDSISALMRAKTHCPKGHALEPGNLDGHHASKGNRACKTCVTARCRAYKAAYREARALGLTPRTDAYRTAARLAYARIMELPDPESQKQEA